MMARRRRARRHHGAAPGRAQPRDPVELLHRRSCARRGGATRNITPHFFSAPEIHQMVEVSGLDDPRRARGALRGRAAHAAGRRRGDPRDARAQADLGQEGRARGVARRAPRRAPGRHALDRDHDVRPRRDARRARRAPRLRPRAAGRDARLHRVRAVVATSAATRRWNRRSSTSRAPHAICACWRSRGSTSTTSITSRRRGSARARRPARSRCTSAPTISAARCSRRTCTSPPAT